MTYEAITNAIRTRFNTEIEVAEGVDVYYDNSEKATKPELLWARCSIVPGETIQVSMGAGKRFRTIGILIAQLFLPLDKGTQEINSLADAVIAAFRSVTVGGVTYRTPNVVRIGRSGSWWQINVNCPFYSDDVTA